MQTFPDHTDAQLADAILTLSGQIAAAEARLLAYIAEFDERDAWAGHGLLSCAHWLSWKTGLGPNAARERVRVARALRELPVIEEAFGAGRLSWSQVRAITRVAGPQDQQTYLDVARHATAAQLERIVRGVRRARRNEEADAQPRIAAYRMRATRRYDIDGTQVITIRCSAEDAAVVSAAIDRACADLDRRSAVEAKATPDVSAADVSAETPMQPATIADGLLELARIALEQHAVEHPDAARRKKSMLTAQVDPLSGWGRLHDGEILPPTSLKQVLTTLPGRGLLRMRRLTAVDLTRRDLGRTQREANQSLRELLGTIDGERCRFPGCTRQRKLHAHHVVYWSDGGGTDLDNLVLVCSRHHTLIHQQGFQLTLHDGRRLSVATADGVPLLHHPALPWGDPAALDQVEIDATTLPPDSIEARIDLGYVVNVVMTQAA
jgi:hypothetical protein